MAANRVTFRPTAEADLIDIYEFVAHGAGPMVAHSYVERLTDLCHSLVSFPMRGRLRSDLADDIRTLVFEGRATIAYRIEDDRIRIVRILHAGRNVTADLFDQ